MIDSKALQLEVTKLEADLRKRCDADPTVDAPLLAQYDAARAKNRTALTYPAWREEELTQIAVAWVLGCVFVRFLEDNGLVERHSGQHRDARPFQFRQSVGSDARRWYRRETGATPVGGS